jgi:hypothetical protein
MLSCQYNKKKQDFFQTASNQYLILTFYAIAAFPWSQQPKPLAIKD